MGQCPDGPRELAGHLLRVRPQGRHGDLDVALVDAPLDNMQLTVVGTVALGAPSAGMSAGAL